MTENELEIKRRRVRRLLDEQALDGLLLATPPNFAWITGGGDNVIDLSGPTGVAAVLCTRDGETLITNTIEQRRLLEEAVPQRPPHLEVFPWYGGDLASSAQRLLPQGRLGADLALPGFSDCSAAIASARLLLTDAEIARYRVLCREVATGLEEIAATIEPGMTEYEIAGAIAAAAHDRGATPLVVLVATDERIVRHRHPTPTAKPLEHYALLVICARRHGLIACATRSVHFGPLPESLERRHEACARVDAAFLAASRPGASAGSAFAAGAAAYAAEGYADEWMLHHQGGATGYLGREWFAVPDGAQPIENAMALAWNPSITGTKTEDTVLLHEGGLEIMTATGAWPTLPASADGQTFQRPAILVR